MSDKGRKHRYPEGRKIGGVRTRFRVKHVKAPPKSLKHGLDLFDRAMKAHQRRSDLLLADDSKFGQVVDARVREYLEAYGGDDVVTPMLRTIIRTVVLKEIVVESTAQWMFADDCRIINKRKRDLQNVVMKWNQLTVSIADTLTKIGLYAPPPKTVTIADIIAEPQPKTASGGDSAA